MFTCLYQLWDWLDSPPLFNAATMDSKKLQQLQQANSHLAPQKKVPLSYQTNIADYRTSAHSPVFQNHHLQYHGGGSGGSGGGHQSIYQQQQQQSPSSSGSQLTPIDMQPQGKHNMLKTTAYHQQQFTGEQIYQTPPERTYQMSAAAGRPLYQTASSQLQHNPVTALQQQYQQLQQAKIQAQIQTQNEALVQQQRTFAMRQALNPPVPQGHYHMSQSSSLMSSPQQQQSPHHQSAAAAAAASSHRTVPPSTLNLSSQFQPAPGPLKVAPNTNKHFHQDQASLYAQQQHQLQLQLQLQQQQQQLQQQQQQKQNHQLLSNQHSLQDNGQSARQKPAPPLKSSDMSGITPGSEPSPVYIQQNHPGHVVNQACQTQLSGALGNKTPAKTPSSEDSSNKSPSGTSTSAGQHSQLDRKKSSGSIQALKSPITKRPPTSPVAMSGWLYKQGSDGLKVWRKRWFVLAEYCLYYYKGPEEEKLLGSILLPSYKVSACLPEDKIYRKYAFKCEHTNMRTYWLAAETAEAMIQWVRALTAATMMQVSSESDQTSQPSVSSLNQSADNSDSGIHTLQSQQSKMSLSQGPVTPASDNGAQPLYANAPPKPRRINDGGYSSPSPEHSVDNEGSVGRKHGQNQQQPSSARRSNTVMSPSLQQMQRSQHHAIYDSRTGNVTSSLRMQSSADNLANQMQQINMDANRQSPYHSNDYSAGGSLPQNIPGSGYNHQGVDLEEQLMRMPSRSIGDDIYGERELYMQKIIQQRYPPNQAVMGGYASAERRTPDAYGRSKNRPFSDYEDIYNLTQQCKTPQPQEMAAGVAGGSAYRRPMSPPTYDSTKHVPPMPSRYTPNHLESTTGSSTNLRTRPSTASIIRPHSADFLEYEARVEAAAAAATSSSTGGAIKPDAIRAPRPKSSLDINRAPDSFYYSEASYAEKMRQSALYLQSPQTAQPQQQQQQQQHHLQQQQQPPPPAPASAYGYTAAYPSPSGMHTIGYENPYERAYKRNELLQEATINQGTSSVPRMSRGVSNSAISKDIIGSGIHLRPQHHHQGSQQLPSQHEQFLRSASARLPRNRDEDAPSTPTSSLQDGERKREESMKRLLEWKQRMLQSPLTRKGMQQSGSATLMTKLGSNPNILAAGAANNPAQQHPSSGVVAPHNLTIGNGSASGANGAVVVGGVSGIQRSRSETHANAGGYNSFSSDDEDGSEKSPAGRSSTTTTPTTPSSSMYTIETNKSAIDIGSQSEQTISDNINLKNPTDPKSSVQNQNTCNNTKTSPKPILECPSHNILQKIDVDGSDSLLESPPPPALPQRNSPALPKKELLSSCLQLEDYSVSSYVPVYKPKILEATATSAGKNYENVSNDLKVEDKEEVSEKVEATLLQAGVQEEVVAIANQANEFNSEEDEDGEDDRTCEYTDDDLDEALADSETATTPTGLNNDEKNGSVNSLLMDDPATEQFYENDPPTLPSLAEDHYLPMTPKRNVLSPSASLVFAGLNDSTAEEENPYVEMTKGLEDNSNSNYEVVCVLANTKAKPEKTAQTIPEPVYMELSLGKILPSEEVLNSGKSTLKKTKNTDTLKKSTDTLKKKSKKSSERAQSKRKDLPDILKPSQSTIMSSDSSDADDESSKNPDSTKMRSRSRFSLSDTFRPASYYLGATTPLANCAESSDSEIVSPPPIPLSPPPMEELNTEEIFSSEHYDTVKRKEKFNISFDQIPKIHSSNSSLNISNKPEGLKSSRLSLPDQFLKIRGLKTPILKNHERTLSDSNYSIQTDNSSNTSSDFDLYNKLKNNSPSFVSSPRYQSNSSLPQKLTTGDSSETDSVEYRHRQGSDSELERQRSRRPLSEESISEIESMSEQFEETINTTDLDSYLNHLQTTNDLYIYQNSDKNLLNDTTGSGVRGGIIGNLIKPPEIFRNKGDEHFYGNINFVSSTDSLQKLEGDKEQPQQQSLLKEKNLSLHDAQCASADVIMTSGLTAIPGTTFSADTAKSVTLSSVDLDQTSFCTAFDLTQITPIHSRNNSNISEQSAPYYYSELTSSRELASPITLNNKRDIAIGSHHRSATGISHIHNPISKPTNPVIVDNMSLKGSARSLSVDILTEKDQTIDSKNLYKTKTNIEKLSYCDGKSLKIGGGEPLAESFDHHSHHQRQTSLTFASSTSNTSSPLPSVEVNILSKHINTDRVTELNNRTSKLSGTSGAGEQLWEEDALWRESLRRVSQRHARSMDELDRIQPATMSETSPQQQQQQQHPQQSNKVKISRDVTYVNDNVSGRSSYKTRLSDPIHESLTVADAPDEKDENDVYVQLAAAMDDVYEVLREDSGGSNYSRKSTEIDRETIRQWDSMSSGLMKNSGGNNGTNNGNSARGGGSLSVSGEKTNSPKSDSNESGLSGVDNSIRSENQLNMTETETQSNVKTKTVTFAKLYTQENYK
ncbi:uncharacterized protein LOC129914533 isoform X2 [Episyrphus balteatus]|uniref:uncharacterized protein LOC129914533 isoform X2 n=1 Tax=Episyrphus balteatus TaxID=286459 RepID=UPI002484E744|nr:uncharacterized protein LOC129914533 isoform X2 [Episyrphus balteatus]